MKHRGNLANLVAEPSRNIVEPREPRRGTLAESRSLVAGRIVDWFVVRWWDGGSSIVAKVVCDLMGHLWIRWFVDRWLIVGCLLPNFFCVWFVVSIVVVEPSVDRR